VIALVYGGAASGKSEYAEAMMMQMSGPRIYVATMRPFDEEAYARVEKHVSRRREMGFSTEECYDELTSIDVPGDAAVLLECMGNLTTNLLYAADGEGTPSTIEGVEAFQTLPVDVTVARIDRSIDHLCAHARDCVLVSNDIFSSGEAYPPETTAYVEALGQAMAHAAENADFVIEVVCGIPVYRKGTREGFMSVMDERSRS